MNCKLFDLRRKEVISMRDGARLGYVGDVELDTETAQLVSIVIYGKMRWLGILGREDDIVVRWDDIQIIGEETILVKSGIIHHRRKRNALSSFFWE